PFSHSSVITGTCWTINTYCIYQPKSISVKKGDSVTIPCTYSYPEHLRVRTPATISWGETDGTSCYNIKKNIADSSGHIADEYIGRVSTAFHPDNRTASLTLRGLSASHGMLFCCGAAIPIGKQNFSWYNPYGTALVFSDKRSVSQVEELIAVPGEEITIPCHYPLGTPGKVREVSWYSGKSKVCAYNKNKIHKWNTTHTEDRFSLVNFPEDVSLRIHSVQNKESLWFCCNVTTSYETIQSTYSTELTLPGPPSSSSLFNVTQPSNIAGQTGESVTLSCSYSGYVESDVLRVNIYWRVGNITGPYVYHPYKEMVHPGYRGRTEIKGRADLHIRGLQKSDESSYYCFVMIRLCIGHDEYEKRVQYGEGTRLVVVASEKAGGVPADPAIIIFSFMGFKFFLLLLLFVVTLFCYKHK
ncbi:hypothetical protein PRIEUP_LOCUS1964, partial [Pristimantis euphronides]